MFSTIFSCFGRYKQRQYRHPCILVGPVIDGRPVAHCNRRVLYLRPNKRSVETGDIGAVKDGRGRVSELEFLGRVTVPLEGNLELVQGWVEETYAELNGDCTVDTVIESVKDHISTSIAPARAQEIMVLEIFRAVVLNRMEDKVFVFRTPSSL
jgi:hypothetical protein